MNTPINYTVDTSKLDTFINKAQTSVYPLDISVIVSKFGSVTMIATFDESGVPYSEIDKLSNIEELAKNFPTLADYLMYLTDSEHWSDGDGIALAVKSMTDESGHFHNELKSKKVISVSSESDNE